MMNNNVHPANTKAPKPYNLFKELNRVSLKKKLENLQKENEKLKGRINKLKGKSE